VKRSLVWYRPFDSIKKMIELMKKESSFEKSLAFL
jgi:hypothetical protein